MRARLEHILDSTLFQNSIIGLIIINAVILGLETSTGVMDAVGVQLKFIDGVILWLFVAELLLRLYVRGLRAFITNPWSVFDTAVVAIAFVPDAGALAALRALRILRVLRLVSAVPSMRRVVEGLLTALPGIGSVSVLMMLVFYVFSVIGTHLYSATFPEWFGSLGATMYTLFQIMTLESWSMGIVRPVMEQHPFAWLFFVIYILMTTFTMLNLFIAIIVNSMSSDIDEDAAKDREDLHTDLKVELAAMEQRLMDEIAKQKTGPSVSKAPDSQT